MSSQERRAVPGHLQRPQLPQQPRGATEALAETVDDAAEDVLDADDAGEDQQPTDLEERRVDATWSWGVMLEGLYIIYIMYYIIYFIYYIYILYYGTSHL